MLPRPYARAALPLVLLLVALVPPAAEGKGLPAPYCLAGKLREAVEVRILAGASSSRPTPPGLVPDGTAASPPIRPSCPLLKSGGTVTWRHIDSDPKRYTHDPASRHDAATGAARCFKASWDRDGDRSTPDGELARGDTFAIRFRYDDRGVAASGDGGLTWVSCNRAVYRDPAAALAGLDVAIVEYGCDKHTNLAAVAIMREGS